MSLKGSGEDNFIVMIKKPFSLLAKKGISGRSRRVGSRRDHSSAVSTEVGIQILCSSGG